MAHHEAIGFVRTDDGGAILWASIIGHPRWVVEARVLPLEAGPSIGEVRICPLEPARFHDASGMLSISSGRVPVDETGAAGDPTWSGHASAVPAGGVPSRAWHAVNLGELLELAQRCYREWAASKKNPAGIEDPVILAYLQQVSKSAETIGTARRGRKGRQASIDHYLKWAVRYADKAGSRRAIAELADEYLPELGGDVQKARVYVRDTIRDARYPHQLLTKATPGRAGGALTDKARRLLAERATEQEDK